MPTFAPREQKFSLPLLSGAIVAAFVSAGALIESILGSVTGFHEFTTIQSRNILVGLCFFVFLAAPVGAVLLTTAVHRHWQVSKLTDRSWAKTPPAKIGPAVLAAILLIWIIPLPFHYFLPHSQVYGNDLTLFWGNYLNMHWDVVFVALVVLLASDIVLIRFGERGLTFGRISSNMFYLCTFAAIAMAGTLYTYSRYIYTNIPYSMGGGAPRIVFIEFEPDTTIDWASEDFLPSTRFERLLSVPQQLPREERARIQVINEILIAQAPDGSRGPFLLWRENADYLFVTDPASATGYFRSGVTIRKDQVTAIAESGVMASFSPGGFKIFDSWGVRAKWLDRRIEEFTQDFIEDLRNMRNEIKEAADPYEPSGGS